VRIIRDILVSAIALFVAVAVRLAGCSFESILTVVVRSLPVAALLSTGTMFLWRLSDRRTHLSGLLLSVLAPAIPLLVLFLWGGVEEWISRHWFTVRILAALPSTSRAAIFIWVGLLMASWGWLRLYRARPVSAEPSAGGNAAAPRASA